MFIGLKMQPHIQTVDRTHPVGALVGEYGDNRYWQGFGHGFCFGIVATCVLGLCTNALRFPRV